jgi:hypothetical protein
MTVVARNLARGELWRLVRCVCEKPQRISSVSFDFSSDVSVRGFFGKFHAVAMVVREEMSGPLILKPNTMEESSGLREHALMQANTKRRIILERTAHEYTNE